MSNTINELKEKLTGAIRKSDDAKQIETFEMLLAEYRKQKSLKKSIETYECMIPVLRRNNLFEKLALNLISQANLFILIPEFKKALELLEEAEPLCDKAVRTDLKSQAYSAMGKIHNKLGNIETSLEYLYKSMELFENSSSDLPLEAKLNNHKIYASSLETLAMIHHQLGDVEKARESTQKALNTCIAIDFDEGILKNYNNLGAAWQDIPEKSMGFYKQAQIFAEKMDNKLMVAVITSNIGGCYEDMQDYENALDYYNKAIEYSLMNKLMKYLPFFYMYRGDVYRKIHEYDKAIVSYELGKKQAEENNMLQIVVESCEKLCEVFKIKNDYKIALDYLKTSYDMSRKMFNSRMKKQAETMEGSLKKIKAELKKTSREKSIISKALKNEMQMNFIGESLTIRNVLNTALKVADYRNSNVIVTGESGTGKEIISNIIHYASSRKENFIIPVNCSAIPESLAESEFFGHVKGAFTGADDNKDGYILEANGGTLFLDEIGDMPLKLQAKLLRAIETQKIRPVGSAKDIDVDFRVVAATNRNINDLISNNKFRGDLFYRLNTIEINIPPLRERKDDIKPLIDFFVKSFARSFSRISPKIEDSAVSKLLNYSFPGNVRELKNMIERAFIVASGDTLKSEHFPIMNTSVYPPQIKTESGSSGIDKARRPSDLSFSDIKRALESTGNNKTKAAKMLGISYSSLVRRIRACR